MRFPQRLRALASVASLAVAFTLITSSAPAASAASSNPTPTDSSETSSQQLPLDVSELEAAVAELSARAAEINSKLEKAALEYENGEKALAVARAAAAEARTKAAAAEEVAEEARKTVGDFVRSSYINPIPNEAVLISAAKGASPTDAVKGAEYLDRIGRDNGSALTDANEKQNIARSERRRANTLEVEAGKQAKALSDSLTEIQAEAAKSAEELSAKVLELDQARMLAAAAAAMNGGSPAFFDAVNTSELCARTEVLPSPASAPWGGFSNGLIPPSALCDIGGGQLLRWDASAALKALNAAYVAEFGSPICVTDSYRSYDAQVSTFAAKPGLAATPGKSNHGWGLALDLCGGVNSYGTPQYNWMLLNAPLYGWFNPPWAQAGGSGANEPWHWNFGTFN